MIGRILSEERIRIVSMKPDISAAFRRRLLRILAGIEAVRGCGGVPVCVLDGDGIVWIKDASEC
jgi:hypothetical protein